MKENVQDNLINNNNNNKNDLMFSVFVYYSPD